MPASNVDLSAVLPMLTDAVAPVVYAMALLDNLPQAARPNDNSRLRSYAPLGDLKLNDVRKLLEAIEAVYRMAGTELKPVAPGTTA